MTASTPAAAAIAARLFDLIQAPVRWNVLHAGVRLGVFDRLKAAASAREVAAALSLDPRRIGLYLDALCAMGLAEKNAGRYRLAAAAAPYLLSDGKRCLGPMLTSLAALRHADIASLLPSACPPPALDMGNAAFWNRAGANLRSFHRAMAADVMVDALETLPEWPRVRRLLDLGAGSEVLALTVTGRRPDMSVTVFDLPPLAAGIAAAVAETDRKDRIEVIAGDYNEAAFGGGYDMIWASMTLYYAHDLVAVLAKARDALEPGGLFVSFHEGLSAERTSPEAHVIGRLIPALQGQDLSFDRGQIAAAMASAGFARVEEQAVETPFGPMVVDIGSA
jgi:SAM-dependent methyltransferase